jgi:sRNA-binding protein
MPHPLWLLPALLLPICGWLAAAWYYKRKLRALQGQVQAIRQMAAEHAQQARWQIGQLQAELAARAAAATAAERDKRAAAPAPAPAPAPVPRTAEPVQSASERAFAPTAILNDGFAETVVERSPLLRR